jgi:phosphoribosylamine-glycine ligase
MNIEWSDDAASSRTGIIDTWQLQNRFLITGLNRSASFWSSTPALNREKAEILTSGGQVLTVVATGKPAEAGKVYTNVAKSIEVAYRKDIAQF